MTAFDPAPALAVVERLRAALRAADYTVDAVADLLGPVASAALGRFRTVPAVRALAGDGSPLATLVRLWPLQREVPAPDLDAALPGLLDPLVAAGVLARTGDGVRALVDIRPYGDEDHDWWVVCDLVHTLDETPHPVPADHVPGVGGASTALAQLTVRRPVRTALDLGTGNGVQAFHLSGLADRVVATDVSRRALDMAALGAALNGLTDSLELRAGSLFEPVAGQRFDLVVSNPPFVVSPQSRDAERFTYRDSGLPGDELGRVLLAGLADHLAPGGTAQLLANWEHRSGEDWRDRVAGWLGPLRGAGADVLVVERERLDPAAYAETWLRDAALDRDTGAGERYGAWLADAERRGVEAVGFGWVCVRAAGHPAGAGTLRLQEHHGPVAQPVGPAVGGWLDRVDWLARAGAGEEDLRAARLVLAAGVDEERYAEPGAEDPRAIVLRQHTGLLRTALVDTATAGLVGACDGSLAVGSLLAALAELLGEPADVVADRVLPRVRDLVEDGFLLPAG